MVVGKVVYHAFEIPSTPHKRFYLEPGWQNQKRLEFSYSQLTTGSAVEIEMKNDYTIEYLISNQSLFMAEYATWNSQGK